MHVVIVETTPPAPSVLLRALLDACSSSAPDTRCEAATDPEPRETSAVAIVRWEDSRERTVSIEVGLRKSGPEAEWQARTLTFQGADSRPERWRAVGLTIATMASTREQPARPAAPRNAGEKPSSESGLQPQVPGPPVSRSAPEEGAATTSEATRSATPETARTDRWRSPSPWVGLAATLGRGVDASRIGAAIDGGYQTRSPLFVRAGLALSSRGATTTDVTLTWWSASVGGGAGFPIGPAMFLPRGGLRLESVRAASPGDSRSHTQLGLEVGLDAAFSLGDVALVLGVEAWRNHSGTEVRVGSRTAAVDEALGWQARAGIRYRFGDAPAVER